jgi:single-strand DNA-binding protein
MTIITTGIGRVGKDAVTRSTSGGDPVTGFPLAMDNGWGDKKQTLWFDCSGWGKRYEGAQPYLIKGAQVFVVGELGEREHDGKTYKTLRLYELQLIGGKPSSDNSQRQESRQAPADDGFADDSIPF